MVTLCDLSEISHTAHTLGVRWDRVLANGLSVCLMDFTNRSLSLSGNKMALIELF